MGKLVGGEIGAEGDYKVELVDKKIRLSVGYDGQDADAGIFIEIDPCNLLDKLKTVIPGKVDDAVIEVLKAAFIK